MALFLCIETATDVCSVALAHDTGIVAVRESAERNAHSASLTLFIDEVMHASGKQYQELDAIAVSKGPGSYTGLRIGVSAAKGLCYALGKPLIAVPTLQSMAGGMNEELKIKNYAADPLLPVLFAPLIDARRMEVYCALYGPDGKEVREVLAEIIDETSFGEFLANNQMIFGGDGAAKCKNIFGDKPNTLFLDDFRVSAGFMVPLALERFTGGQFEDLAYFEPFYLKDFVAGKPRVKGLG